jgi:hypothetical protein
MWSVFECEYKTKVEEEYKWVKELRFYMRDISNEDLKNDWRFCEVKDKRKQAKFLGTVETEFPIKFPLTLYNGKILEKENYYHKRSTEE